MFFKKQTTSQQTRNFVLTEPQKTHEVGGTGGSEFETLHKKIIGISIFARNSYDSEYTIQVLYENGTVQDVGGEKFSLLVGSLDLSNDTIVYANVAAANYVCYIKLKTRSGQVLETKSHQYTRQAEFNVPAEKQDTIGISGLHGRAGAWLDALGFIVTDHSTSTPILRYPAAKPIILGGGSGGSFFQTPHDAAPITSISLCYKSYVNGMIIHYAGGETLNVGTQGGHRVTMKIDSGDHIVQVTYDTNRYVQGLMLTTRSGKTVHNSVSGKWFTCNAGEHIVGFCGRSGSWLDAIGVLVVDSKCPLYRTPVIGCIRRVATAFQSESRPIKGITFHSDGNHVIGVSVYYAAGDVVKQGSTHGMSTEVIDLSTIKYIILKLTYNNRQYQGISQVTVVTATNMIRIGATTNNTAIKFTGKSVMTEKEHSLHVKKGMVICGIYGVQDELGLAAFGLTFEERGTLYIKSDMTKSAFQDVTVHFNK